MPRGFSLRCFLKGPSCSPALSPGAGALISQRLTSSSEKQEARLTAHLSGPFSYTCPLSHTAWVGPVWSRRLSVLSIYTISPHPFPTRKMGPPVYKSSMEGIREKPWAPGVQEPWRAENPRGTRCCDLGLRCLLQAPHFSSHTIRQKTLPLPPSSAPLLRQCSASAHPSRLRNYYWPPHPRPPTVGLSHPEFLPLMPFETYLESNNQLDGLKKFFKMNYNKASFIVSSPWATGPRRNEQVTRELEK